MAKIMDKLDKLPQYTRKQRHMLALMRHSTPAKIRNLFLVETERKLRKTKLKGRPYIYIIDPINLCNLRCPLCPTGIGTLNRPQVAMSLANFKHIIDKVEKYAYEVTLHDWGESLLHPQIFEMIKYANDHNISTNISSNFNLKGEIVDKVPGSGLEYLVVSLDGVDEDTYQVYRRGGTFKTVWENLNRVIAKKRELKTQMPFIEWQFIVMKHNMHQVDQAKKLAKDVGVDLLRFIPVGLPFDFTNKKELREQWFPNAGQAMDSASGEYNLADSEGPRPGPCFYLYRSITVHPNGHIAPCCIVYDKKYDFGNILKQSLEEIWNNPYYLSSRSLFSPHKLPANESLVTVCNKCDLFETVDV